MKKFIRRKYHTVSLESFLTKTFFLLSLLVCDFQKWNILEKFLIPQFETSEAIKKMTSGLGRENDENNNQEERIFALCLANLKEKIQKKIRKIW